MKGIITLFIFFGLFIAFLVFNPSLIGILILSILIFLLSAYNTNLGLLLWTMSFVTQDLMTANISVPSIITPTFFMGCLFYNMVRLKAPKVKKEYIKIYLIIFAVVFPSLAYGYYTSINAVLVVPIHLIVAIIVYEMIKQSPTNLLLITIGVTFGALIATIYGYLYSTGSRFNVAENVRLLANPLSLSLVLMSTLYFFQKNKSKMISILFFSLFCIITVGLISTVSRGSIFSVGITLMLIFLLSPKKSNDRTRALLKRISFLVTAVLLFALVLLFYNYFASNLFIGTDYLLDKFSSERLDGSYMARSNIWLGVLFNRPEMEIIFGSGTQGFSNYSNTYSHSLFVDTFVSGGILAIIVLVLLISEILFKAVKNKNYTALIILIFTILNFLTFGIISSMFFWIGIAISFALVNSSSLYNKINSKTA